MRNYQSCRLLSPRNRHVCVVEEEFEELPSKLPEKLELSEPLEVPDLSESDSNDFEYGSESASESELCRCSARLASLRCLCLLRAFFSCVEEDLASLDFS